MEFSDRYADVPFLIDRLPGLVQPGDGLPAVLKSLGSAGIDVQIAAALVGVTPDVFEEVLEHFEELRIAWDQGQAQADSMVTFALYQKATSGDVQAQKFWLSNRLPEVWTLYGKNTSGKAQPNGGRPKKQEDPFKGLQLIG